MRASLRGLKTEVMELRQKVQELKDAAEEKEVLQQQVAGLQRQVDWQPLQRTHAAAAAPRRVPGV